MKKNTKILSLILIMLLILSASCLIKKNNRKLLEKDYSQLAIFVNGEIREKIPTDKYYFMASNCSGGTIEWDILYKKLKIKESDFSTISCTLNFEEVDLEVKVNGETDYSPTGNLNITEQNCGDAEINYLNNKLNIKFNSKPAICTIELEPSETTTTTTTTTKRTITTSTATIPTQPTSAEW